MLFSATQHAREWIAAEIDRRLMYHYVSGWAATTRRSRSCSQSTELWFVPVMNPDGYQYSFDAERLWRKNLRDNDGDDQTTISDGVDPNRNYPEHFKYDEEGSSKILSSQTYRGPAAGSERETQAIQGLSDRVGFAFNVNYHSNGRWLLYPEGWQVGSPTADDPIYFALSGNLDRPAIEGYHPGLSSDVLYVTNGEANDFTAQARRRAGVDPGAEPRAARRAGSCSRTTRRWSRRSSSATCRSPSRSRTPRRTRTTRSPRSASRPSRSTSSSDDPYKEGVPGANFAFKYSYGDPQPVQVLAKRALGAVTAKYRINGGAERSASDVGVEGRRALQARLGPLPRHARHGDRAPTRVTPSRSGSRAAARGASRSPTRPSPSRAGGCSWWRPRTTRARRRRRPRARTTCSYYLDALAANGVPADVYDVDARGRIAPDQLGVLSHYDGVIWYTGDDIVTRRPGWPGGNADRLALDEMLEMRAYMDEGGRVLYTGKRAGQQYTGARRRQPVLRPEGRGRVQPTTACRRPAPRTRGGACCCAARCSAATWSTTSSQYWFGGMVQIADDGHDANRARRSTLNGIDDPFDGLSWALDGPASASNQDTNSSFVTTSGILPRRRVPAVREQAVVALGQARRAVRPALGQPVRVLADRRRVLQAAHA